MLRRVKIMCAIIALTATVSTIIPAGSIKADATEKKISSQNGSMKKYVSDELIEQKICSYIKTQYEEGCTIVDENYANIDLELTEKEVKQIAQKLCSSDKVVKKILIKEGKPEDIVNAMTKEQIDQVREPVCNALYKIIINLNGQKVPIYTYAVIKNGQSIDKGFFVGGTIGAAIMQVNNGKPIYISNNNVTHISDEIKQKILSNIKKNIQALVGNIIKDTEISDKVDDITDTVEDFSDAIDDLADSIKDKADDIDDAWDKVFDRFDNEEGWGHRDGYIYYYDEDRIALKGVQEINGKTYYFNRIDGAMETGWQVVDGKRCYFDKNKGCQVFLQWVQDGDDWYFLSDEGPVKKSEWVNDNGKYYYLKSDGKMTKNWLKIDDNWYYFNESTGVKETSKWKYSSDKWYYLTEDGKAANDWTYINNNWYYFRENSSAMESGWFRADGSWYYADSTGAMKTGWVYGEDGWYYLDDSTGKMKKNEWVYSNENWYYFNVNGNMVTKSRYIDGVKYNFNSDGRMI